MAEVTEKQFNLIKAFCNHHTGLVICPLATEKDDPASREASAENKADLAALADGGFLQDFTEEFLKQYQTTLGQEPPRPVVVYIITKMAYEMFGPKDEEMVN